MKTPIALRCAGTSRSRFLSLAVSLWLGLSGVFLIGASIEKVEGATDPFREFYTGGIPDDVLFDGTYIWVADFLSSTVTKLQPNDGTILDTFPTGAFYTHNFLPPMERIFGSAITVRAVL
jgi:hypothetical protein